jgi:hypothetical protein
MLLLRTVKIQNLDLVSGNGRDCELFKAVARGQQECCPLSSKRCLALTKNTLVAFGKVV